MAAAAATATATATATVAALQEKQSQELSQYGAVRPRSSSCVAHVCWPGRRGPVRKPGWRTWGHAGHVSGLMEMRQEGSGKLRGEVPGWGQPACKGWAWG